MFAGALYTAPNLIEGIVYNGDPFSLFFSPTRPEDASLAAYSSATEAQLLASFVVIPFIVYADLVIIRWAIAGIELTNGPNFVLPDDTSLSWAGCCFSSSLRSPSLAGPGSRRHFSGGFAGNVEGDGVGFDFVGSGWGLLWRAIAFLVVFIALIYSYVASASPVPLILEFIWGLWVGVWLLKWVMRNVVLFRLAPSPGTPAPEM